MLSNCSDKLCFCLQQGNTVEILTYFDIFFYSSKPLNNCLEAFPKQNYNAILNKKDILLQLVNCYLNQENKQTQGFFLFRYQNDRSFGIQLHQHIKIYKNKERFQYFCVVISFFLFYHIVNVFRIRAFKPRFDFVEAIDI